MALVVGGTSAAHVTGLLDSFIGQANGAIDPSKAIPGGASDGEPLFYDLPALMVNLPNVVDHSTFLKLRISLELGSRQDVRRVEATLPRIIDLLQTHLRELRLDDLKESTGIVRLRAEILTHVATTAAPARVDAVLFKEIVIQ